VWFILCWLIYVRVPSIRFCPTSFVIIDGVTFDPVNGSILL